MAHVHPRQRCVCPLRYLASSTIDTNSSSFCHRKTQMKARLKKSTSASVNADASGKKLTEPSTTFERHLQEFNTHTGMSLPSLHRRTPCLRRKNITYTHMYTCTHTHTHTHTQYLRNILRRARCQSLSTYQHLDQARFDTWTYSGHDRCSPMGKSLRAHTHISATSVTATDTHRTTWRWKRILQSNDRDEQCYYSPHGLRLAEIKPQAPTSAEGGWWVGKAQVRP